VTTLGELRTTLARDGFRTLNSVVVPLLDRGFANPPAVGVGAVVVETTGRSSGRQRRVPLLSARIGDTVVVSTIRTGSHWFANLEADRAARVHLAGRARDARASLQRGALNVAVLDLD